MKNYKEYKKNWYLENKQLLQKVETSNTYHKFRNTRIRLKKLIKHCSQIRITDQELKELHSIIHYLESIKPVVKKLRKNVRRNTKTDN